LEADRNAALVLSERKTQEAKLIKARQEKFQAGLELFSGETSTGNPASGEERELSADRRVRDERISEPQETRQRRGRRPIRELILRELSFSGQAMAAAQIAKAINYIPERTETALGRMEKDIDWKAEGIRSSALEFVAYSLGFFHDGHRAASDCRATLHALAQPLPGTGRLAFQALLEQARLPTWRLWARDAAIEKKMSLRPEATRGAPESLGDQDAGTAMCRTRTKRQRCRGSGQM
jgi:hypothetical protein